MPAAQFQYTGVIGFISLVPWGAFKEGADTQVSDTTDDNKLILKTVQEFVRREVIPVASSMERKDEYPQALIEEMIHMGLFGLNVPERFGGAEADYKTIVLVFEELGRAWFGLSGILGTHLVLCDIVNSSGTEDQKQRFLPILARGEQRGAVCLSEANAGTDLQSIRTTAIRDGDVYRINGSKMWITNARHAGLFLLLAKTNPHIQPMHKGMSAFIVEKGDSRLTIGRDVEKLGYKGPETCEVHFDDLPVSVQNLIGKKEGNGFYHVMKCLETERINVAARSLGIARASFEEAINYAQQRVTFGKAIAEHQAIQLKLADMATKIEASRLLIASAADKRDRGERCDLEVGMAKVFASDTAVDVSLEAMRILGANGYSKDFPVERYYRDAPMSFIGGGTSELQRLVIARRLLEKYSHSERPQKSAPE
jgi:alkylation response protein AidB-like acyl-CoA dehydrogenase